MVSGAHGAAWLAAHSPWWMQPDSLARPSPCRPQVVMRDRVTNKPRGFGFITFTTEEACQSACADPHLLDGRQVGRRRLGVGGRASRGTLIGGMRFQATTYSSAACCMGSGRCRVRAVEAQGDTPTPCPRPLQIDVKPSVPQGESQRPRSKKIFVGGLAPETTEGEPARHVTRADCTARCLCCSPF